MTMYASLIIAMILATRLFSSAFAQLTWYTCVGGINVRPKCTLMQYHFVK